jgi:DNA repair protein RecN (Recombination protein N)
MLLELAVTDLGVIDELALVLGPGMTAVTGETGAGKTLVVTAIDLLVGGRADALLVAPGRAEAVVEGRFVDPATDEEIVVRRVVPADGRSRAYIDGRLATAGELAEVGARFVDLHGQHAHQSLLASAAQRDALDAAGGIDLGTRRQLREERDELVRQRDALGGDEQARAREVDLLRYQVEELARAALVEDEDTVLEAEEAALADASAHIEAALRAAGALDADEGAEALVGEARAALGERAPFAGIVDRLRTVAAELADLSHELRQLGESITDDPERLAAVQARRQTIHELSRKYGPTVDDVLAYAAESEQRLADLEQRDERAQALDASLAEVEGALADEAARIGDQRRDAAPLLARRAVAHLRDLALPQGRLDVEVGPDAGDAVEFLFAADPGGPLRPLRRVASGGELARVMLALRLVLTAGPDTLVFDEVDAGIGGTAALAVGRSLAALGTDHQVLVVTHLPQVAAYADAQVAVSKQARRGRTRTEARLVDGEERVVELSRMLSGSPGSDSAQEHAAELIASAAAERGR